MLQAIVETTIRHREAYGHRYHGGAVARIIAQVPKGEIKKDDLITAIEQAFKREENCYF